jgi:hypothetical protein
MNKKFFSRSPEKKVDYSAEKLLNALEMRQYVRDYFSQYAWDPVKMENNCVPTKGGKQSGGATIMTYTPTQAFVSSFFTPSNPLKGMLLWHSVGTGKTCTAIATATSTFEKQGYTILWVTRTTLKNIFSEAFIHNTAFVFTNWGMSKQDVLNRKKNGISE